MNPHHEAGRSWRKSCLTALVALVLGGTTNLIAQSNTNTQTTLQSPVVMGTNALVQWNSAGSLQFAPNVTGPWTTATSGVSSASSFISPLAGVSRFFRVVSPSGVAGDPVALIPDSPLEPLAVTNATVQLLTQPNAQGNSVLRVRFEPGQNISSNGVNLLADDRVITLLDDGVPPDTSRGDGTFSAFATINVSDLQTINSNLNRLLPSQRITKVFDNRRVIATNQLTAINITNFSAGVPLSIFPPPCVGSPFAYNSAKTLMITDVSVVQDANRTWDPCPNYPTGVGTKMGAWTFGRLMSDMATPAGISPSDFVRNWLRSWQFDQMINADGIPNRNTAILTQVINAWQTASGGPNAPLDVSIAPFRLLAIVNRVDLRGNTLYGGGVPSNPCDPACIGGESRFVFCVVNPANCTELLFTVILEYCNPPTTCAGIKAWAKQWADLNLLNFSPGFNAALQAITDQFAGLAKNPSQKPNKSFLNQLRSNELLANPWQCLQWELSGAGSDAGHLRQSTVNQTPDLAHNNTAFLQSYVTDNLAAAAAGKHTIPLLYGPVGQQKQPFLGATAPMANSLFFWNFPGSTASATTKAARHHVSLNSCNGCHAGETGTPFTHVSCRSPGFPAPLSQFLTGVANFPDPVDNTITYTYADLERRVQDLDCVVNSPCLFQIGFKVLSKFSVH